MEKSLTDRAIEEMEKRNPGIFNLYGFKTLKQKRSFIENTTTGALQKLAIANGDLIKAINEEFNKEITKIKKILKKL